MTLGQLATITVAGCVSGGVLLASSWMGRPYSLLDDCEGACHIAPGNCVVQIGHATPWAAEDDFGTIQTEGACPHTTAASDGAQGNICQVATKVMHEGDFENEVPNLDHFGIRLKDADVFTPARLVGGDGAVLDEADVILQFRITGGTATVNVDYFVKEQELQADMTTELKNVTIVGDRFDLRLQRNNRCVGFTDSGTSLAILTRPNDDNPGSAEPVYETVEMELIGAHLDDGVPTPLALGWSTKLKWIIEDDGD